MIVDCELRKQALVTNLSCNHQRLPVMAKLNVPPFSYDRGLYENLRAVALTVYCEKPVICLGQQFLCRGSGLIHCYNSCVVIAGLFKVVHLFVRPCSHEIHLRVILVEGQRLRKVGHGSNMLVKLLVADAAGDIVGLACRLQQYGC